METLIEKTLDFLLTQSLHLSILFVLIAAFAWLLRGRSAHLRYLLWLLILIKCFVPPVVTVPLAVLPSEAAPEETIPTPEPSRQVTAQVPAGSFVIPERPPQAAEPVRLSPPPQTRNPAVEPVSMSEPEQVHAAPAAASDLLNLMSVASWLLLLWLGGAGLYYLAAIVRAIRFHGKIRRLRRPVDSDLQKRLAEFKAPVSGGNQPRIYLLPEASQPFVWGLVRGAVYLPAHFLNQLDEGKRLSILLHEMAHVKRLDPLLNLLQVVAQGLYWFHPLVWIANHRIRAEREKCCDEAAIAHLKTTPKEYGSAIVEALTMEYRRRMPVPTLAVAGPVKNIEDRIKTIMQPGRRFAARPTMLALISILLLAAVIAPTTVALTSRSAGPTHEVIGSVTNAITGKPIEGAIVFDDGYGPEPRQETTTMSGGAFSYKSWNEEHNITAQAEGYVPQTLVMKTFPFDNSKKLNFKLQPEQDHQAKYSATLPNGAMLELVGLCRYTEDGIECFRPDGSPLGRQLSLAKWNQEPAPGDVGILLKLTGPEDVHLSYQTIENAKGWEGSCQVVDENGQTLEGYEAALTRFDASCKTTSLRFGLAAGEWTTVAEHDGKAMAIRNGISFTRAVESGRWVEISASDTLGRDVEQRLAAVDSRGILIPWQGTHGSVSNDNLRQSSGSFPDIKLEQIQKFVFQTRPYQWATFSNVSLWPGVTTDASVGPREGSFVFSPEAELPKAEDLPGKLIFHGRYRHRSRNLDIEAPGELWLRQTQGGELIALSYLPWRNSYDLAVGDAGHRMTTYRTEQLAAGDQQGYKMHLDLLDGKALLTRRGVREDCDRRELAVPRGALFNPNSRPDSYTEANVFFRSLDLAPGESREFCAYDWDNAGEGMADYTFRVEHAGKETVEVPAGAFEANHYVLTQLTSADTWFKKRAGHVTDFWILDSGVIVRVLRHREPYEMLLLDFFHPQDGSVPKTSSQEKENDENGPEWVDGAPGLGGHALKFDGAGDFVLVANHPSLEPKSEITIEMWARLDGPQSKYARLLRKSADMGAGYILTADQGDGKMQIRLDDGNTTIRALDPARHTERAGVWHHFAAVYDQSRVSLYIDGKLVDQKPHEPKNLMHSNADLYIGCGMVGREFFKGLIDEVRLWDVARSAEQIRENMGQNVAADSPGLIGYWKFDEGDGNAAHDSSVNQNHGTLKSTGSGMFRSDTSSQRNIIANQPLVEITPMDFGIRYDEQRGDYSLVVSICNEGRTLMPKHRIRFYRGEPTAGLDETGHPHTGWYEAGPVEPGKTWNESTRGFALTDGEYEFHVVLDYDNTVKETDENNNAADLQVRIENGRIADKTVLLPPDPQRQTPFSVFGRVTDVSGNPLAGVTVRADCGWATLMPTGRTVTDADGRYRLYFKPGYTGPDQTGPAETPFQAATITAEKQGFREVRANLAMAGSRAIADASSRKDNFSAVVLPDEPYELNFTMEPAAQ